MVARDLRSAGKAGLALAAAIVALSGSTSAPASLQSTIRTIAAEAKGTVAVACGLPGRALDCNLNSATHAPMQSVFKLPLVVTVLRQVEAGRLAMNQLVRFSPDDRFLPPTVSPLQDRHPQGGVDVSIQELSQLAVSESDNVAADILLRTVGGPAVVTAEIQRLSAADFHLEDSEHGLHRDVTAQYRNWMTPLAAVSLLRTLADHSPLSPAHTSMLFDWMEHSVKARRLKGDLPPGIVVAHKPGTSGVDDGLAHATNDIGLITLPTGVRLAVAVFVVDARAPEATREKVIARIARAIYDAALNGEGIARTPRATRVAGKPRM